MPKTFYTERDIEDMVRQGQMSLQLSDDIVLTELAYEKAERLGLKLLQEHDQPPVAPVRPYISKQHTQKSTPAPVKMQFSSQAAAKPVNPDIKQRVRDAVIARLGNQVDPVLLDTIINRVLSSVGVN